MPGPEWDVVVAGGGPSGCMAAAAAAAAGARTLLVEREPYPGGTATACMVAELNGASKGGKSVCREMRSGRQEMNADIRSGRLKKQKDYPESSSRNREQGAANRAAPGTRKDQNRGAGRMSFHGRSMRTGSMRRSI